MEIRPIPFPDIARDCLRCMRHSRRAQFQLFAVSLLGFAIYAVATRGIQEKQEVVYLGKLEMEIAEHALVSLFAAQQDTARVCYQWVDHDPQTGFTYSRRVDYDAATGTMMISFVNASPGNETIIKGATPSRLREILRRKALYTTTPRRDRCDFTFVAAELWKASDEGTQLNAATRRPHRPKRDNKETIRK